MKTPLQKVIQSLQDLHDENDGHTAYQQAVSDCCDICRDHLKYEQLSDTKRKAHVPIILADENLSVTHYQNGDRIAEALTPEQWVEYGENQLPAFMRNGNDFHYNHFAVADRRGLAPEGWRIPTEEDMNYILEQGLWRNLPKAGFRNCFTGSVGNAGSLGSYWSSTMVGSRVGGLNFGSSFAYVGSNPRSGGHSVRLVKNN